MMQGKTLLSYQDLNYGKTKQSGARSFISLGRTLLVLIVSIV